MGLSLAFGAAGATDAVGVGVGGVGDVEVDDVADLGDVDAPGGDVRGHQDPVGAGLEAVEGGLALALGQVALDAGGAAAGLAQHLGQGFGLVLGAGEHDDRVGLGLIEQFHEQRGLAAGGHGVDGVVHGLGRGLASDAHGDGIGQDVGGQLFDGVGHGGREEQVLAFGREPVQDGPDVREEAHVEHVVGLVQDQGVQGGEVGVALADVVQQASGAGHDDVHAAAQGLGRGAHAHAAIDGDAFDVGPAAEVAHGVVDLFGQFPGGGHDQGLDGAAFGGLAAGQAVKMGSRNAAVLPVPVWARPMTSRPSMTGGMASVWMGVGAWCPGFDVGRSRDADRKK
jgi:hypothetical protein